MFISCCWRFFPFRFSFSLYFFVLLLRMFLLYLLLCRFFLSVNLSVDNNRTAITNDKKKLEVIHVWTAARIQYEYKRNSDNNIANNTKKITYERTTVERWHFFNHSNNTIAHTQDICVLCAYESNNVAYIHSVRWTVEHTLKNVNVALQRDNQCFFAN